MEEKHLQGWENSSKNFGKYKIETKEGAGKEDLDRNTKFISCTFQERTWLMFYHNLNKEGAGDV